MASANGKVYSSPEAVEALQAGSSVPSVVVESLDRESVDLSKLLRDQGALLVFYRGGW
jgi:hypothetical protein